MCTADVYRVRRIPENKTGKAHQSIEKSTSEESSDVEAISASAHFNEAIESLKKYRSMI